MTPPLTSTIPGRLFGRQSGIIVTTLPDDYADGFAHHKSVVSSLASHVRNGGDPYDWTYESVDREGWTRRHYFDGAGIARSDGYKRVPVESASSLIDLALGITRQHADVTRAPEDSTAAIDKRNYARRLIAKSLGLGVKDWAAQGYPIDRDAIIAGGVKESKVDVYILRADVPNAGSGTIPSLTDSIVRPGTRDTGRTIGQGSFNN